MNTLLALVALAAMFLAAGFLETAPLPVAIPVAMSIAISLVAVDRRLARRTR
ncbi:hypothetical protein [Microbacterium sp.]|uniref:hypothetical protein n=1 Tax=Microbacterium sp. TaxID=51671 RepID=UPI002812270E|nr:hypothetical protein [Microbacterium sp.]